MTDLRMLRALCVLALVVSLLAGAIGARADINAWTVASGTNDWYGDTNYWSLTHFPLAGEDVVITNAGVGVLLTNSAPASSSFNSMVISNTTTLVFSNWDTALSATDVKIQKSAIVTCAGPFTNAPEMSNRVYVVCSNLTIEANGKIDVNRKGYCAYAGPGAKTNDTRGGGSHGGLGGGNGASTYGSFAAPADPGSGGVGAGHAGGVVRVTASGAITINGTITANGVYGNVGAAYGSGSGGSVWLDCWTLAGTGGVVTANGGAVGGSDTSGTGGGGRIAVIYNSTAQGQASLPGVTFQAAGGKRDILPSSIGELGSLYFPDNLFLTSPMKHSGQWMVSGVTSWEPNALTLTNAWIRFPENGFALTVTNDLLITGDNYGVNGLTLTGGRISCGGNFTLRGSRLMLARDESRTNSLSVGGNLVVTNASTATLGGGNLVIYASPTNVGSPWGGMVSVGGLFYVATNCAVLPYSHPTNGGSVLFSVRDLTVAGGGILDANSKGYAAYNGPGVKTTNTTTSGWGASYGGMGGGNTVGTYGSSNAPVDPGSGGAGAGYGGGVIRVTAAKTITIYGTITANGLYASSSTPTYGSGSGGSVYLVCRTLAGNKGTVTANGGDIGTSTDVSGTGGGGRIAIWRLYDASIDMTNVVALPGVPGSVGKGPSGTNGTVFWGWLKTPGTVIELR